MRDLEKMQALHCIIDLRRAAQFIVGHSDNLLKIEDCPEMVGLSGIHEAIEVQAHRLLKGMPEL